MLDLGALKLAINVESGEAKKALTEIDGSINESSSRWQKLGNGAKNVGTNIAKGVAVAGTAIAGATTALVAGATKTAEFGDRVDKMSQKLGMTTKGFQEWDYILGQNGASIDGMKMAMKTLISDTTATNDAFAELGIVITDSMSQEEIFDASVKALQQLPAGVDKARLAQDLFGKSASELMPLLNQTAEGTEELRQRAYELGLIMSDETVTASVIFGDTLDDLKGTIAGLSRGMTGDLLPSMTTVMEGLIGLATGADDAGVKLEEGMQALILELGEMIPKMMEKGMQIIQALIQGLVQALPKLIPMGVEMLMNIIEGIVDTLPELVDGAVELVFVVIDTIMDNLDRVLEAGINILLAISLGIIDALPKLIAKIPTIIVGITTAIVDNLPKIIEAGIQILFALLKGIVATTPVLISEFPKILGDIIDTIVGLLPQMLSVGADLIDAFLDGIKSAWQNIDNYMSRKVSDVIQSVKDAIRRIASLDSAGSKYADSRNGSHRNGLDYVPFDGYVAELHKGERVLTAKENSDYQNNSKTVTTNDTFIFEIKADNIKELNNLVDIAQNARRNSRMTLIPT